MERTIKSTSVTDINGGFIVRMGAVAAQRSEEQLKDLMYLCANALSLVVIENEDMKKLILEIDSKNEIPLKSTTNNNVYIGATLSTEEFITLNQSCKINKYIGDEYGKKR